MRTSFLTISLVVTTSVPALLADVTLRFQNEIKFGAVLPAPIAGQSKNGTASALPPSTVFYRKGDKGYVQSGKFSCLMDFAKKEITVLDAEHQRFATVAMKDYSGRLTAAMPPALAEAQSA